MTDSILTGLTIYDDLTQGTDEWIAARAGMVTASTVGKLLTPTGKVANNDTARTLTLTLAAERITGRVVDVRPTSDMIRGTLDEPFARDLYAEHTGQKVEEIGFMVRKFDDFRLGASPDGLIGETGGIEIKSRRPKQQLATILNGRVPAANMAQVQASLLVSGREWWDYCSYAGSMALYIIRVYPDPAWFKALTDATAALEESVQAITADYEERTSGMPVAPFVDHFADELVI